MGRPKVRPEFYSIKTPCACGCGGFLYNPDDHYRFRKFLPNHYDNVGEKHPRFGKKEERSHLERRVDAIKKTLKSKPPTCLEKELFIYLDQLGIKYVKQVRIGVTIVDAFVPDFNLCIFADGKYWHEKPEMIERDQRHNKELIDTGYKVLRLQSINYGYNLDFEPLKSFLLA